MILVVGNCNALMLEPHRAACDTNNRKCSYIYYQEQRESLWRLLQVSLETTCYNTPWPGNKQETAIRLHKAPFWAYFSGSVRGYFKAPRPYFRYFDFILRVLGGAQSALDP